MSYHKYLAYCIAKSIMNDYRVVAIATILTMTFTAPNVMGAAGDPVVTSSAGKVQGYSAPDSGILSFKGLHYGESTAGSRRFKPPLPVKSWEGIRDATDYGPTCSQVVSSAKEEDKKKWGKGRVFPQSEDCLVLNVWTPGTEGRRPVMFWMHGGGFSRGDGSSPYYDGTALAKRGDVVVITVNHRLNVFGYLHLADLAGADFSGSGMAGMLDLELALKWVRQNIASFGGNPDNVTIFGESGGGFKACHLLAMPSAKGLFHKAIIQSGSALDASTRDSGTEQAKALMTKLGISDVQKLQEMPAADLVKALYTGTPGFGGFGPVVDGTWRQI